MKTRLKIWATPGVTVVNTTPHAPLIKTIVKVVAPEIGNKIYDGAVGSAGFLVEAFEYLKQSKNSLLPI